MNKDEIFSLIKNEIMTVLPFANETQIKTENCLADLGANSIDRSEIAINCMANLDVKLDPMSLASVKNIGDLLDKLYQAKNQK